MIRVDKISKEFGNKQVLFDIEFEVTKGEVLGFLGPNGAGKTTTMRILTGFLPATRGSASVAGFDIFEKSIEVRKHIGYLPESPPLYYEMTVKNYLEFVARIKGIPWGEISKRVEEVMDKVNITHMKNRLTGKLSKGYKQRVGLAQAMIHNPPVLILDEPTSGLDPKQIIEVRELIKNLSGDHTVILSTHILPEATLLCDRVLIINEGKIIAQDSPANLDKKLKGVEKLYVEVNGPKDEISKTLKGIPGIIDVSEDKSLDGNTGFLIESEVDIDVRKDISRTIFQNNWDLFELRAFGMSLEEIFLQLTTNEEEV
ncbi:MAG: ABC transporter ATP-binding protein [bacterium]|nr:ABC transporter ATP-binding protein [bacterium]